MSPDGEIIEANQALVQMLGFDSLDDLLTSSFVGYTAATFRLAIPAALEYGDEIVGLRSTWRRKDASLLYVRQSVRAVRDDQGRLNHNHGLVADVTDRQRPDDLGVLRKAVSDCSAYRAVRDYHH
jgi:PAS domain-containing protein